MKLKFELLWALFVFLVCGNFLAHASGWERVRLSSATEWSVELERNRDELNVMALETYNLKTSGYVNPRTHEMIKQTLTPMRKSDGINLGYGMTVQSKTFQFVKMNTRDHRAVLNQERVAIKVGTKYLKYKKRDYGINLGWSKTPVFEWQLRNSDPRRGIPVDGREFQIYNQTIDSELLWCDRNISTMVNLSWRKNCFEKNRVQGTRRNI